MTSHTGRIRNNLEFRKMNNMNIEFTEATRRTFHIIYTTKKRDIVKLF